MKFNSWITCAHPEPNARMRLFCLPFAGGGASLYRKWGSLLGPEFEVCAIQLPGRENRIGESPQKNDRALASLLANHLSLYIDKPYVVYGHSMGGLLVFEVLRQLQNDGHPLPQVAFIAAHRAAHLPPRRAPLVGLDNQAFINKLIDFGGFEPEILANKELLDFILPTLRADFEVCDGYQYSADIPLDCPLVAISGSKDLEAPPEDMEPWKQHSLQTFQHITLDAGHFFLKTHTDALLTQIRQHALQHLSG